MNYKYISQFSDILSASKGLSFSLELAPFLETFKFGRPRRVVTQTEADRILGPDLVTPLT